jgi:hypothetical protein
LQNLKEILRATPDNGNYRALPMQADHFFQKNMPGCANLPFLSMAPPNQGPDSAY